MCGSANFEEDVVVALGSSLTVNIDAGNVPTMSEVGGSSVLCVNDTLDDIVLVKVYAGDGVTGILLDV